MRFVLRALRPASIATLGLLAACSGSGGNGGSIIGGPGNGYSQCNPGTSVALANPTNGSYNVPSTIGNVTVVANGNNDYLYTSYSNWTLELQSNTSFNSGPYIAGSLNLVSDPSAPHPYPSDYYYQSPVGTLQTGQTWTVLLQDTTSNCQAVAIGSFST